MVWKGSRRAEAAEAAGMTDHSLRSALKKRHVLAFMHSELGALRESERPRTLHRLAALRDQDKNLNAAVNAAKAMEAIPETGPGRPGFVQQLPGLTVVIRAPIGNVPTSAPIIDVTPEHIGSKPR
jgi:hypothetical protein